MSILEPGTNKVHFTRDRKTCDLSMRLCDVQHQVWFTGYINGVNAVLHYKNTEGDIYSFDDNFAVDTITRQVHINQFDVQNLFAAKVRIRAYTDELKVLEPNSEHLGRRCWKPEGNIADGQMFYSKPILGYPTRLMYKVRGDIFPLDVYAKDEVGNLKHDKHLLSPLKCSWGLYASFYDAFKCYSNIWVYQIPYEQRRPTPENYRVSIEEAGRGRADAYAAKHFAQTA